jgi:hypothetical protein
MDKEADVGKENTLAVDKTSPKKPNLGQNMMQHNKWGALKKGT